MFRSCKSFGHEELFGNSRYGLATDFFTINVGGAEMLTTDKLEAAGDLPCDWWSSDRGPWPDGQGHRSAESSPASAITLLACRIKTGAMIPSSSIWVDDCSSDSVGFWTCDGIKKASVSRKRIFETPAATGGDANVGLGSFGWKLATTTGKSLAATCSLSGWNRISFRDRNWTWLDGRDGKNTSASWAWHITTARRTQMNNMILEEGYWCTGDDEKASRGGKSQRW